MSMSVISPGLQSTLQDLGRYENSHFGISVSGAADMLSIRIGNLILGNEIMAAAIEMTIVGGNFKFHINSYIAISGSDFDATLDGESVSNLKAIKVLKGQVLTFGKTKNGARTYLCIRGGFKVDNYLSSKSTHLVSSIGGYLGRALMKGDKIKFNNLDNIRKPFLSNKSLDLNTDIIRVSRGLQDYYFNEKTWEIFISKLFTVSNLSSRMGLRLTGNTIRTEITNEIITEGVPLGAIQVPGSGEPIISFVEHQTTGGYPKIANIISADLHRAGQLKPGDQFQFKLVSIEEAEILRLEQESYIESLINNE